MRRFILVITICFGLFKADAQNSLEERVAYARGVLGQGLKTNDSGQIAEGYYLLGKREMDQANFAEAYKLLYHALKINDARKDYFNTGKVYLRLSTVERKSGNVDKSLDYVRHAISAFLKIPDNLTPAAKEKQERLASAYEQSGNIYFDPIYLSHKDANLDSALHYYQKAEALYSKENKEVKLGQIQQKIGRIYILKKDKRSIDYLESALLNMEKADSAIFRIQVAKAKAWRILGNLSNAQKAINEAETIIKKGTSVSPDALMEYHTVYADYYTQLEDFKNALAHKEKVLAYFGMMSNADGEGNMSLWRIQLETHKKDLELELQQEKINNKQKRIVQQQLFIGILALFFVLLLVLIYYLNKSYQKQKSLTLKNEVLIQEQNHRVKNNLQVISSLLDLQADHLKDKSLYEAFAESQTRINSMLILHRQLYKNGNVELINISDFLTDIGNSVAQTFGKNHLAIRQNMSLEYLKTDISTSIGLIFNELVINSFKYAFSHRKPSIEIHLKQENNNILTMTYKDFGKKDLSEIIKRKNKETFGLSLIEMILFQIDGNLNYSYEEGSVFTIQFKNI